MAVLAIAQKKLFTFEASQINVVGQQKAAEKNAQVKAQETSSHASTVSCYL